MNSHTPEQPAPNSPAAPPGVVCSDLVRRLHAHIAMMAPQQRERYTGQLLVEATAEICKLHTALCDLMPYVLEDYYPNCATGGYRASVEAAKALMPNGSALPAHLQNENFVLSTDYSLLCGASQRLLKAIAGLSKIKDGKTLFEGSPTKDAECHAAWVDLHDARQDVIRRLPNDPSSATAEPKGDNGKQ